MPSWAHVAALVNSLGQMLGLQGIPPDGGLSLGRESCEALAVEYLGAAGPALVFFDGLDDPQAPGARELLTFAESLGTGHMVVFTSRGGRRSGHQYRLPPLGDVDMATIIAQDCARRGVSLDEAQRRAVRERACGLPSFACQVVERMQATSVSAVMAQLDGLWAAFARRTFDGLSRRLQSECQESHRLLCTLARDPAFNGARVVALRELVRCAGRDGDTCESLLDPLLLWNMILRKGSWNYVMPPAVCAYFAQVASTMP
jgi:hypothetical protein